MRYARNESRHGTTSTRRHQATKSFGSMYTLLTSSLSSRRLVAQSNQSLPPFEAGREFFVVPADLSQLPVAVCAQPSACEVTFHPSWYPPQLPCWR